MKVVNDDVRFTRIMIMVFCFIIPIAPFLIAYLLITRKPTDIINGLITNKRSQTSANIPAMYFVTVDSKELNVSDRIYHSLNIGDYISASYRKEILYYYTVGTSEY